MSKPPEVPSPDPKSMPTPMPQADAFNYDYRMTQGIRAHAHKDYFCHLAGSEWQSMLALLEEQTVQIASDPKLDDTRKYDRIRALVIWTEKLREQLRAQGF